MAKVHSQDLRERVIRAVENGQSASAAARVFGVSRSAGIKWVQHWRLTGVVPKAKARGQYRLWLDDHRDWLLHLIDEEPDLTLDEIRQRLASEREATTCVNNLWRFFDRNKVVYKKNGTRHRTDETRRRQGKTKVAH